MRLNAYYRYNTNINITQEDFMIKQKIQWQKGIDFIDNSPRYTFENRDPSYTSSIIRVVIYQEKIPEYQGSNKKITVYYGSVENTRTETGDTIGYYKTLKEAKEETLRLFEEYCTLFPEDID
jgi:hypothetical protein